MHKNFSISKHVLLAEHNSPKHRHVYCIELVKSSSFSCVGAGRTRISPAGWPATLLSAFFEFHISTKSINFLAFWYY